MIIKRFFSAESSRRLFSDILKENSGTILALGAIGSGSFGIGFYINQMRVFEEKLNAVKMEARKDTLVAEEKINAVKMEAKKDSIIAGEKILVAEEKIIAAEERAKKDTLVAEEKLNAVKMEAKKDSIIAGEKILVAEEKINAVKMQAKKDSIIAEERARKEALQLLYNIFTQEEYKDAKKKMMAQKDKIVNDE